MFSNVTADSAFLLKQHLKLLIAVYVCFKTSAMFSADVSLGVPAVWNRNSDGKVTLPEAVAILCAFGL